MDQLFGSFKGLIKFQSVAIDNGVFKLHYKITAAVLIVFSLLVSSKQQFGDPIECISKDDIPKQVLETFCWVHATFSLEKAWKKDVGLHVAYPGVDNYLPGDVRIYHAYYQWVCFVLFLQAILFYVPRYFWKCMEKGRVKALVMDLQGHIIDEGKKKSDLKILANYFVSNLNNNEYYSYCYVFSEILNAINVIGQMYLMDAFLGGAFSTYGAEILKFSEWDWSLRYDPMIRVFPRLTKCTFHRYGSSGDVQRHDAMCILPINIINEKIYVFLWFWFVVLSVVSCLALAYRGVLFFSYELRMQAIRSKGSLVRKEHAELVVKKFRMGDWFLLHLLAKNLHSAHFRDFMAELSERLGGKGHNDIGEDHL